MVKVLSERVEYVAECLATALEIAPSLDEAERAQLAEVLPFATPYWLDSLIASGSSHESESSHSAADEEAGSDTSSSAPSSGQDQRPTNEWPS